jgi:S-adenosylmethionine:tRNA ribosyltransferase-isomerase
VQTDLFDYHLPLDLIAQHPVEPRDRSRLLVIHRVEGRWEHRVFADLPELLLPGDLLVRNDTRVLPARLLGRRTATGGSWEGLYLGSRDDGSWEILARTRGSPRPGEMIEVDGGLAIRLLERLDGGRWLVRPDAPGTPAELLERFGHVPLPPYIRKGREGPGDRDRYQTVYARAPGSVAAPTAGLHFTDTLLRQLRDRGVESLDVTLHVGLGTFRPIEVDRVEDHVLHSERAEVTEGVAERLNARRREGGRILAVGTTSARTLESAARSGTFRPLQEETSLYIRPGHEFRGLDGLITNFHLPRSSLLVLVAALIGVDLVRAAYDEAVRERYRFYSYGDAMLILP